jgi:hypothetical protein
VQVKRTPGQRTSKECGNHGYRGVAPRVRRALPSLALGASHVLSAEIDGSALRVLVDGALVWEGDLPVSALEIDGPIGVRSDNVRFEGELRSASGASTPCKQAEYSD